MLRRDETTLYTGTTSLRWRETTLRRDETTLAPGGADYFAAGTLVVWDLDTLRDQVVRVYRAGDPATPTTYHRGDHAEAEPAVPDWSMPVDDLFLD